MVEVQEYFEGKVKSLSLDAAGNKKTLGVMEPGEYEFDTQQKEVMTIIAGELSVYFADSEEWEEFGPGASFDVAADSKLKVKALEGTAYLCDYEG